MKVGWRIADVLTGLRLLLIPVIWLAALMGQGRLVGVGLLVAGATDFLDGHLARRLGQESAAGARLDALADNLLLVSAMAWMALLHPEILRENTVLVAVTVGLYIGSLPVGRINSFASKIAGGALYLFALITLVAGGYEPLLLRLAAAAFIVSSAETLLVKLLPSARRRRVESTKTQAIGSARKQRSHAPQPANVVGTSANPTSSIPISAAPNANEMRP